MDTSIVSQDAIWKLYKEARRSLDPIAAVEHVAGVTGLDSVRVESVVQGRESLHSAAEGAL